MQIIDVSRYEFKYLLTADEVPEVRRFVLRYCAPDTNANGLEWYGIRSLYLDSPDYAFFRASVENAHERLKLRVRGYASGTEPVKLEIKHRIGDVVLKKSVIASAEIWGGVARAGLSSLPSHTDGT